MHNKHQTSFQPSSVAVFHGKWQPGHVEANRRIYDFELVYFVRGVTKVITPDAVFYCGAGRAIIIPPDLVHCSVAVDEVERWCIHFDWFSDCRGPRGASDVFVYTQGQNRFKTELCASSPKEIEFPFSVQADATLFPLIRTYFLATQACKNPLIRQGVLSQILGKVLEMKSGIARAAAVNHLALAAKNKVDEKCRDFHLTVGEIAREMHVSANHLSRLFHRQFGCSVTEYVARQRMTHIEELLADYTLSISEIAEKCGFSGANYFCRFFRRQTGVSPGVFRRQKAPAVRQGASGIGKIARLDDKKQD